ncbi:hypoxanthine phosphoribosyltransferase [Oribacterium asaccharolyticum ACB7]|jgi:hypoxanthine phosphoribosyltransferase|uniref:Hypoxanthine phosphoribosyltransferase n=2 Tax=Oribacterium TaxID=265975 RepID=G9WVB1_9FIRM|nr:hypoxanthine phosphoribosyltransferase [Oribacterium asaccharolyticum ACB7]
MAKGEDMKEEIEVLYTEQEIEDKVKELAAKIDEDYKGKAIHLICVLKGGAMFMCDLAKRLKNPLVTMDFMAVSSYGNSTESSGVVRIVKDLDEPLEGKHVLLVEDIVDTGRTLSHLTKLLQERNPASLKICTLLDKPERRECEVEVQYTGFQIPDIFIVGYGIDYQQKYRGLPYLGGVHFKEE